MRFFFVLSAIEIEFMRPQRACVNWVFRFLCWKMFKHRMKKKTTATTTAVLAPDDVRTRSRLGQMSNVEMSRTLAVHRQVHAESLALNWRTSGSQLCHKYDVRVDAAVALALYCRLLIRNRMRWKIYTAQSGVCEDELIMDCAIRLGKMEASKNSPVRLGLPKTVFKIRNQLKIDEIPAADWKSSCYLGKLKLIADIRPIFMPHPVGKQL